MTNARALAVGVHTDPDLRARAEQGLAGVLAEERRARHRLEQAAKQRRLLARFDEIHLGMSDRKDRTAAVYTKAARAYARVFRENDLDPDRLSVEEAAKRIRALPAPVAQVVTGALDYWVFAEWCEYWTKRFPPKGNGPPAVRLAPLLNPEQALNRNLKIWRKRLAIAQAADPDPLRRRLRDALTRLDFGGFKKIVNSADAASLPAPSVRIVAETLYVTGGLDRALELLRRAQLRAHAGDFWVNHLLASYSGQTSPPAWDDVVRYASAAVALRPDCVQALHVLGDGLEKRGDTARALEVYRQILRVRPGDGYAHTRVGAVLWKRGDRGGALAEVRQAVRLEPESLLARLNLGRILRETEDLEGALAEFRAAARLYPDDHQPQRELGETFLRQGNLPEAAAALARASQLGPKEPENHFSEGVALRRQGKLAEAEAALRRALALSPGLNEARFELAATLTSLGRRDEAVAAYRELLRRQPGHAAAHNNLGVLLQAGGKPDAALAAFREAVRLNPAERDFHFNLAQTLQARGDRDGATAAYRELLRRWPDDAQARQELSGLLKP
jgi:tetratricopeptide (TPR) repeat protein